MLTNVKDFDAAGDGTQDDRLHIQAAIDHAVSHNTGGVFLPAGTYRVSRVDNQIVPDGRWSLDLNGVQDFMVLGEGPKSVVKLVDTTDPNGTGNWHVFILRNNCRRVVFKDLVIDGNRTGLTKPSEQSHGIEVEPGTEDLVVDGCILRECFGDGMRLLGAPGQHVKRLRIENSLFQTNKRSGLAIQRALEQIIIANCTFDSTVTDQSIDFEPSGHDGPTDLVIHGCIINHTNPTPAVTLSGISGPEPLVRCKFTDNVVIGGNIFCTDVSQLTIQNNTVRVTSLGQAQHVPIVIQRGGDSLIISGNVLVNDDPATRIVILLDAVNQRQVTRAIVADNLCVTGAGLGIQCLSSDDVAIQGNMIVATGECNTAIAVRSESSDVDGMSIRDNDITAKGGGKWNFGIRAAATAPHSIDEVSIIGNSIRGAGTGLFFEGPGFRQTPVCALNRLAEDVPVPFVGLENLPSRSIVVSGVTSRGRKPSQGGSTAHSGAGRMIAGLGSPEGKVIGNVGDIFQQLDGTPGKALWVKESDDDDTAGWAAK